MKKLALRSQWYLGLYVFSIAVALALIVPHRMPHLAVEVPLIALAIFEAGVLLSSALLLYDEATPAQVLAIVFLMLLIASAFILAAHVANPLILSGVRSRPGSEAPVLSINWAFLLLSNLGTLSTVKVLIVLEKPGKSKPRKSR
ncbi:MAG TPA: hypothetical protein V6D17_03235 [Candidatus Obscuribacterales bacterium]